MNASRPMFNTLVEFAPGSTKIAPGLAESWSVSEDGHRSTHSACGAACGSSRATLFRPTREMNADDVLFSLLRQWKEDHPYHRVSGSRYDYFQDLGMGELLSVDRQARRPHGPHPADAAQTLRFLANLAMPFNVILSAEYADAMLRAGTPERLDQEPIGTGPFAFVSFQKDVAVRYRPSPTIGAARSRSTASSSRSRPIRPCGSTS